MMLNAAQRWRRLPLAEQGITLLLATVVPLVSISLTLFGFARTRQVLQFASPTPRRASAPVTVIVQATRAIKRLEVRTPWLGRCLSRSMSLWWLLRRRGFDAKLHLGVRTHKEILTAHAWLEHDGVILNESVTAAARFPAVLVTDLSS